jgi:hypothetical protein
VVSAHIRAIRRAAIAIPVVCLALAACGGSKPPSLLSELSSHGNASVTSIKLYEQAVTQTRRAARSAPRSAPAWDAYAKALFQLADTNYFFATSTTAQGFTIYGARELAVFASAWRHYISLAPTTPDALLAGDVAFAFGSQGIGDFGVAETGQQIVAKSQPRNYHQWATLAVDAYLAHDTGVAVLAAARALQLAPLARRAALRAELQAAAATSPAG